MSRLVVAGMPARMAQPWLPAFGDGDAIWPEPVLPEPGALGDSIRVVCFYCAPWDMLELIDSEGPEEYEAWLSTWLDYHTTALETWRAAPERMLLVNARRAGKSADVARRLVAAGLELDPACAPGENPPALPAWARGLLAGYLAESAPEVWECYEALEACAMLTGPAPEFRGTAGLVDMADASAVIRAVTMACDGLHQARAPSSDLYEARIRLGVLAVEQDAVRHENEMLPLQVGQLRPEIELVDAARRDDQVIMQTANESPKASAVTGSHTERWEEERTMLQHENELFALQISQLHAELEEATNEVRLNRDVADRAAALAERARKLLVHLYRPGKSQ